MQRHLATAALLVALQCCHWDVAQRALAQGADPNSSDGAHVPLSLAIENGAPLPIVQALLAAAADIHVPRAPGRFGVGQGFVVQATHAGRVDIVRELLAAGANPDEVDGDGRPALHIAACDWGCADLTLAFIEAGATAGLPAGAKAHPRRALDAWQRRQQLATLLAAAAS